VSDHLKQS